MESKPALINDIRVMTDTTEKGRRPRWLMRTYAEKQKVSQAPSQKRGGFVGNEKAQRRQMGNYLSYSDENPKVCTPSAGRNTLNGGSSQKEAGKTGKNVSKIRSLRMRIGAELKGIFQFSLYP